MCVYSVCVYVVVCVRVCVVCVWVGVGVVWCVCVWTDKGDDVIDLGKADSRHPSEAVERTWDCACVCTVHV